MANVPMGPGREQTASGREFVIARDHVVHREVWIDSAARDSGSSPTTVLRKGLFIAKIDSSGRWAQYDDSLTGDGQDTARAILDQELDLLDSGGVAQHLPAVAVVHAYCDYNAVLGGDANGRVDIQTLANGCNVWFEA